MMLNMTSRKLVEEMIRLMNEHSSSSCNVTMLIRALFEIRDDTNNYVNLFNSYFEKKLKIKPEAIDSAIDELMKGSSKEVPKKITLESDIDGSAAIIVDADEELQHVFMKVDEFVKEYDKEYVTPDYFMVALFSSDSNTMRAFLKKIRCNYMEAKSFFTDANINSFEIVPYSLSSFVKFANPDYLGRECDIVGREKELKEIYRIMLKSSKRNVIAYGNAGVGKTAIGEKFIYEIANGKSLPKFAGFKVFEMSVRHFILSCDDENSANEKMNNLMEFLVSRKDDIILLIDEIQMILGKATLFDSKKLDLSGILKPVLARSDIRIIGITTTSDYHSYFENDATLSRRFEGVEVKEPKKTEVFDMVYPRVKAMEKKKGITISDDFIRKAIWYADCFEYHKCNPDKTIDIVDRAMANAELEGRDAVIQDDVINVFSVSFKRWNNMKPEIKRAVALHETGHYVLERLRNDSTARVLAVSIYPTDDYQGVNVFEYDDEVTPDSNREYYINQIAMYLGGRVAEELVIGGLNSGASSDLSVATDIAETMIVDYGLTKHLSSARAYNSEVFGVGTEDTAGDLNDEIDEIVEEAYKVAKEKLIKYRVYLETIANALLESPILTAAQLDEIWDKTTPEFERIQAERKGQKSKSKVSISPIFHKVGDKAERTVKKAKKKVGRVIRKMAKTFK